MNEAFVDIYIDPVNLLMRLMECLYAVGAAWCVYTFGQRQKVVS